LVEPTLISLPQFVHLYVPELTSLPAGTGWAIFTPPHQIEDSFAVTHRRSRETGLLLVVVSSLDRWASQKAGAEAIDVRQLVEIELGSSADAECVAEALASFGSKLRENHGHWTVTTWQDDDEIVPVLDALHQCLDDRDIHSVRISVDGRKYVMERVS